MPDPEDYMDDNDAYCQCGAMLGSPRRGPTRHRGDCPEELVDHLLERYPEGEHDEEYAR